MRLKLRGRPAKQQVRQNRTERPHRICECSKRKYYEDFIDSGLKKFPKRIKRRPAFFLNLLVGTVSPGI